MTELFWTTVCASVSTLEQHQLCVAFGGHVRFTHLPSQGPLSRRRRDLCDMWQALPWNTRHQTLAGSMLTQGTQQCLVFYVFCDEQWRHSVKTRLYNTPSPILHSVKRNDVTRWKQSYIGPLPILHCISQLGENKGGQGHWVSQNKLYRLYDRICWTNADLMLVHFCDTSPTLNQYHFNVLDRL